MIALMAKAMAKAVGGLYCPIKAGLRLSMKACTASERLAVACVDPIRQEHQLARWRCSHQPRQAEALIELERAGDLFG